MPLHTASRLPSSKRGPFALPETTKAYVYNAANNFCTEKNLQVETIKVESRGAIPFVRAAGAELQFKSVPAK